MYTKTVIYFSLQQNMSCEGFLKLSFHTKCQQYIDFPLGQWTLYSNDVFQHHLCTLYDLFCFMEYIILISFSQFHCLYSYEMNNFFRYTWSNKKHILKSVQVFFLSLLVFIFSCVSHVNLWIRFFCHSMEGAHLDREELLMNMLFGANTVHQRFCLPFTYCTELDHMISLH